MGGAPLLCGNPQFVGARAPQLIKDDRLRRMVRRRVGGASHGHRAIAGVVVALVGLVQLEVTAGHFGVAQLPGQQAQIVVRGNVLGVEFQRPLKPTPRLLQEILSPRLASRAPLLLGSLEEGLPQLVEQAIVLREIKLAGAGGRVIGLDDTLEAGDGLVEKAVLFVD